MDVTLLLPTQHQNELSLLNVLMSASPNWLSKDELATDLALPISTIQKSYRQLENRLLTFFPKLALEVNTTLGYRINQNINTHLGTILLSYLQEAPLFNILQVAFETTTFNATLLAESLDISRATYYREVKVLNQLLKSYELSFDSKTGRLVGQRHIIRQFAQQFFWDTYKNSDLPLVGSLHLEVTPLIKQIESLLGAPLNAVTKKKIRFSLTISLLDIRQGLYIEAQLLHRLPKDPLFHLIHESLSSQFYLLSPTVIDKESQFIYQSLITRILSVSSVTFSTIITNYFKDYEPRTFSYVSKLLAQLSTRLNLSVEDSQTFKTDLLISNQHLLTTHHEGLEMAEFSLDRFAQQYPSLYLDILTSFKEVETHYKTLEPQDASKRLKALLTAIEASLDLTEFERDVTIQVISERGVYSKRIKRELIRHSQHKISFSDEQAPIDSPDIIITDTSIDSPRSSALLYHISYPPRATDWQEINLLMAKIS